jgi:hypothetical protein
MFSAYLRLNPLTGHVTSSLRNTGTAVDAYSTAHSRPLVKNWQNTKYNDDISFADLTINNLSGCREVILVRVL